MITFETLAIINNDLDLESGVNDARPETEQLPVAVHLSGQFQVYLSGPSTRNVAISNRKAMSLNSSGSSSVDAEVHLPLQIQNNLSAPSTRNVLSINNQKEMQPSNSNSNKSSKKSEATEQKLIYEKCMKFFHVFGCLLGMRMTYDWKPQRYFMFYSMCFFQVFTTLSVVYTVYVHYVNGRYIRVLEPLAISGLVVSCALKLYALLKNWYRILSLIFTIRKHFRTNVSRQAEIVQSTVRKTWTFLIVYSTGVIFCLVFYAFTPLMVYLTTNVAMPLMPIEFFFADQSQLLGFAVATILHMIIGCYGTVGTLFNGGIIIFLFRNYILQGDLMAEDFQELDGMWNGRNNISVKYKRAFLKNICQKRQDMNNFLKAIKYIFETQFFVYFASAYFSQIICLFDITKNNWLGGYGAACMLFLEILFYCYMGTQVSIVGDKLCYTIYNSNWYMYDLESQRMVGMLLHECQQSKEIKLGPIGALNLMTGIMIVKSIFTYYTVMIELL